MTLETVLRRIREHRWWSEEFPGVYAFAGWPLRAFVEQVKYFHPTLPSVSVFIFRDDFVFEETPADEKRAIYDYLVACVKRDAAYLRRLRRASEIAAREFLCVARMLEENLSSRDRTLARHYARFVAAYLDLVRYGTFLECVDVFSSEDLPTLIRDAMPGMTEEAALDVAMTMAAPDNLSFFEREEMNLHKGAVAGYQVFCHMKNPTVEHIIRNAPAAHRIALSLARDFFWIGNNYKEARRLAPAYFLGRMAEFARGNTKKDLLHNIRQYQTKIVRLKRAKQSFRRRCHFLPPLKRHFRILSFVASWIDDRKRVMTMANHYHELFCQEMARRFRLDIWQVKYYTPEEFDVLLSRGTKVSVALLRSRRRLSAQVVYRHGGWKARERIFYGTEAQKIFAALFSSLETEEIRGQVASAPVMTFRGTAQVVLDVGKETFTKGNILITTMTRPEFLPLLRHAAAIVTDEGGLTCHAAVVSRELGIPCIIGTKIATKALKSGDRIELNLTQGRVCKVDPSNMSNQLRT